MLTVGKRDFAAESQLSAVSVDVDQLVRASSSMVVAVLINSHPRLTVAFTVIGFSSCYQNNITTTRVHVIMIYLLVVTSNFLKNVEIG